MGTENTDPFGLMAANGDPFAAPPPAPQPVAATPPAGAVPPDGTPPLPTPGFVPVEEYTRLKGEVESLKPLQWIGEAMQRDPTLVSRVQQALFSGPGAVPSTGPSPNETLKAQADALQASVQAKIQAGDITGAIMEATAAGATIAEMRMRAEVGSAAGPLLSMTAQNAIENWKNAKRLGPAGKIFAAIEAQFNQMIQLTPPGKLAELAQNGMLGQALEMTYSTLVSKNYESAYAKANETGALTQTRPTPPPYGAGTGQGPLPTEPVEGDNDPEFEKLAAERGLTFKSNGRALVGEAP